jgi:hypothetical protein
MFSGKKARGALIVGADLTMGELVEQKAARFIERFGCNHLAPKISEVCEPVAEVERELLVQFLPKLLGQRGRVSGGRDRDLEVASADHGREVKVTEGRIVDGIA